MAGGDSLYHVRDAVYAAWKRGGLEEILARMDEVLTSLPATEDRYEQRAAIPSTALHQYAEGLTRSFRGRWKHRRMKLNGQSRCPCSV